MDVIVKAEGRPSEIRFTANWLSEITHRNTSFTPDYYSVKFRKWSTEILSWISMIRTWVITVKGDRHSLIINRAFQVLSLVSYSNKNFLSYILRTSTCSQHDVPNLKGCNLNLKKCIFSYWFFVDSTAIITTRRKRYFSIVYSESSL